VESPAPPVSSFRSGIVALVGRPNVGKSTLINRLVGEKVAIVSPVPQTTRTRVVGIRHQPNTELIFIDTPGLHKPRHLLNETMMRAARGALEDADVICLIIDATAGWRAGDRAVLEFVKPRRVPIVLVMNKVDRVKKPALLPLIDECRKVWDFADIVPISAQRDENLDALLRVLAARVPTGEAHYPKDEYTDQTTRTLAAEWIREAILLRTREEVPHAVAVRIEEFAEDPDAKLVRISAQVLVEKESQKAIVIGSGGSMMKQVGEQARRELERLLGCRVYLALWVTVEPNWRQDARQLSELGYA
jgi:GTP-binding protein Era